MSNDTLRQIGGALDAALAVAIGAGRMCGRVLVTFVSFRFGFVFFFLLPVCRFVWLIVWLFWGAFPPFFLFVFLLSVLSFSTV